MPTRPQLHTVLQHPAIWRAADVQRAALCRQQGQTGVNSGYPSLDRVLPDGGWPSDGVAELLCPHWGCGEAELLGPLLRQLSAQPRWLVWVNPPWIPYAPALAQQGIVLENTLILQTRNDKDILWAMEQCLASGSCSLVQGWPANPRPQQIRRLQLAAQKGLSLALLLRPQACVQQPSPAPLRLELGPLQRELQVRVVKCRGNWGSDWLRLKPQAPVDIASNQHLASSDAQEQQPTGHKQPTATIVHFPLEEMPSPAQIARPISHASSLPGPLTPGS